MAEYNPFSIFFDENEKQETTFEQEIDKVIENEPKKEEVATEKAEVDVAEELTIEEVFEKELKQEIEENPVVKEKIEEEVAEENVSEETSNPTEENITVEEPVTETIQEEVLVEEEPATEAVSAEEAQPEQEEQKQPKKRGPKKGTKKKAAAEPVVQEDEPDKKEEPVEYEDVAGGKVASLDEAASVLNIETDAEFEEFREDITKKVNNIYITADINPTSIALAVEAIDTLMVDVMEWHWRVKAIYDNLTNDKDGKLTVVRNLNKKGSNPDERARNSYLALKNFKLKNNTVIDLLDTVYSIRYKYNFVQAVLDRLKMKKDLLVTMTAKLKMEQ